MIRHRLQQRVHQRHVDHRGFVDDEQVAVEGVLLVAAEAAVHRIDLEQPVDGLRFEAGALRQPLGGAAGGRGQRDPHALDAQDLQDRVDQRGLADAGAAGDDEHLRCQRQLHRLALAGGEGDAGLGLDPWDGFCGIDRRPGQAPLHSALIRAAMARSARCRPARKMHRSPSTRVGDDLAVLQLQIERGLDDLGRHLQQLDRHRHQLRQRQAAVALVHRFGERIADAGAGPDHRRLLDAELRRDLIGALEADAADVARQPIGVLRDQPDGVGAVGLEDAHRPRGADAVAVQEDHDLADRLLISPGGDDAVGPLGPDAVDLLQACRRLLDDVEDLLAERLDQLLGVDRADALDHARGEVLLDALGGGRRCRAQKIGAELHAVGPIVDPAAARLDELAGADRRGMADDSDQIALAAGLHPQHAEAAVFVVEGDPLDEAGEVFALGRGRRRYLHLRRLGSAVETDHADGEVGMEGAADGDEAEAAQVSDVEWLHQSMRLEPIKRQPDFLPFGSGNEARSIGLPRADAVGRSQMDAVALAVAARDQEHAR